MRRMPGSVLILLPVKPVWRPSFNSSFVIGEVPPCSKCPVSFLVLSAIIGPVARLP